METYLTPEARRMPSQRVRYSHALASLSQSYPEASGGFFSACNSGVNRFYAFLPSFLHMRTHRNNPPNIVKCLDAFLYKQITVDLTHFHTRQAQTDAKLSMNPAVSPDSYKTSRLILIESQNSRKVCFS